MAKEPNPELQELIQKQEREREEALKRAIAAGGMPTEADAKVVYDALTEAFNETEGIVSRVYCISGADLGTDLPFELTFEQLGVLAVLHSDLKARARDLTEHAEALEKHLQHDLPTLLLEQRHQAEQAEAAGRS